MRRIALALLLGLVVTGCGSSEKTATVPLPPKVAKSKFQGAAVTIPAPAPNFTLHDESGAAVSLHGQRGKIVLVTFLYTHCPDVCPLIASNLNTALRNLGSKRAQVRVLAVSVDPKGDTPAAVRAYAREHRLVPQFRYLLGTREQLLRVWRNYHVIAVDRKPDRVDHVSYTLLLDRSGKRRVIYDSQVQAGAVAHDVRVLLAEGGAAS